MLVDHNFNYNVEEEVNDNHGEIELCSKYSMLIKNTVMIVVLIVS